MSVEGSVRRQRVSCKVFEYDFWSAAIERYASAGDEGPTTLSDVDTRFGYGDDSGQSSAVLSGSFSVRSPETGGHLLRVETPVEFVNGKDESREFAVGRLEIRAEDDSSVQLDTDDGDDDAGHADNRHCGRDAELASIL